MIGLNVRTIGGPEIGAKLADASSGIRQAIRDELADVGEEIVTRAKANAPWNTGILASKIIWFFGTRSMRKITKGSRRAYDGKGLQIRDIKWKDGRINFSAMPTGSVAHLMERGVNASFNQRPGRRGKDKVRPGRRAIGPFGGEAMQGPTYRYARTLKISPRPFFMPAVDSVGGAAGVNQRLQGVIDKLSDSLNRGAA